MKETNSLSIMLGLPGVDVYFPSACAFFTASAQHRLRRMNAPETSSFLALQNFNQLLALALNMYRRGEITHFAMQHADVVPEKNWLDRMVEEMQAARVSYLSVTVPIRDHRGLLSCGVADPTRGIWDIPTRRMTVRESLSLPETFTQADYGYPDWVLLHNSGLILLDLRDERWFSEDAHGTLECSWKWLNRIRRDADGEYTTDSVSEDWIMSWQIHQLGIPSAITRKIHVVHGRQQAINNDTAWGEYLAGDEDTAGKWRIGDPERKAA